MKLTKKQIKILKSNIDKMAESDEQFIFILFKEPDGTDNIIEHSHRTVTEKLSLYFQESIWRGKVKED